MAFNEPPSGPPSEPPPKMGRPSKCTPEFIAAVCKQIRAGLSRRLACVRSGLAQGADGPWMQRGRNGEEPYATFVAEVSKAEADFLAGMTDVVVSGAADDPKLALAVLERRAPEDWAKTERTELSGPNGSAIRVEDARAELAKILGAGLADPAGETDPSAEG
jgi:hypothetical protein